jgi:hypothetical protein
LPFLSVTLDKIDEDQKEQAKEKGRVPRKESELKEKATLTWADYTDCWFIFLP